MTKKQDKIFKCIGASNHVEHERAENDYYATEPKATELLCELEKFDGKIWECACGGGYMSQVLKEQGYDVKSTDLIDRGYGEVEDFLSIDNTKFYGNIVTNPPYNLAKEFVEKALSVIPTGKKVAMFLKVTFLEGKNRKQLFLNNPPKVVYVSSSRLKCAKDGNFESVGSSAVAYAWYVWEKGYNGDTIIKWFN